jgi:HlyD family secretion protein
MNRTRNAIIIIVALLAIVLFSVFAARRSGPSTLAVAMQKVTPAPFSIKLPENGVVQHPQAVTVPTLVAGNIRQILVKAGDHVSAGQLIATIDNPTLEYNAAGAAADYNNAVANVTTARVDEQNARVGYQAAVETQKSSRDEAKRVYDADVALLAQKAIARSTVDADKAKLDQAQVAYDQAVQQLKLGAVSGYGTSSVQAAQAAAAKAQIINQQNQQQLSFTRITSPIDGVVQTVASQPSDALRTLQNGDAVNAGQSLFTIASSSGFIVKAQVDEQDIINVHVGQRANITGQDFPGHTIAGHVANIAPDAEKSTDASSTAKQVLTTIALDDSPSYLRDGMSADVDILTTYIPNALAVPTAAIVKEKGKSYVWVVKDGEVEKRAVVTGLAGDTTTQIKSGLAPGDTIVTGDMSELHPGAKVTAAPSSSPVPAAT